MAQYLAWDGRGPIPYPPPEPGGDWERYQKFTAGFYSDPRATAWARRAIRALVSRRNTATKRLYAEDPAIMAWELANEPRGTGHVDAFNEWISRTSGLIKSLDRRHLVTTGCEGDTPSPEASGVDFTRNHAPAGIDYATIHIWAQNWQWYDPARSTETYAPALEKMRSYMRSHAERARALGKPIVIEEFGLARDSATYDPAAGTSIRDDYYAAVFAEAYRLAGAGAPVAGVNFWAWAGEGRPRLAGSPWKAGDAWIGDPPHEMQGWYSVYDADVRTAAVISSWARRFSQLGERSSTPP
jgi:mannan endo-1,4-beta-mannosidase